jgi:SIR2-like domain
MDKRNNAPNLLFGLWLLFRLWLHCSKSFARGGMRFLQGTPDIPDELIRDVTEGNAVFLCGAGVSMRVNFPSFKRLTERIYIEMGETPQNEPAEDEAMRRGEYDRALRSLEKRTHLPKAPSRVRLATAKLLTAPAGLSVPDHLTLLRLSRDHEGRPRLLTTNFDSLFEYAAEQGKIDCPSYAGKAIPRPGTADDHGVLHIHGRIADAVLEIPRSDLILTTADFGDAYLRDGWLSRYIEDRMRLNTLVLVGYAAEDTAMRLLLDTLDADRDRFRDLKSIYAIDRQKPGSASIWKAKGITPIEFATYDQIYTTLAEWATYAVDPRAYSRPRIEEIFGVTGSGKSS